MNRTSLLHILDHVGRISEAEIRELEQLATTFPYCQTAHVLLAKAAHDRGSMLASQRLRRAATYAADRQLLRQLLEQPAQEPAGLLESPAADVQMAPTASPAVLPAAGSATAFLHTLGTEDVQPLETGTSASVEVEDPDTSTEVLTGTDSEPEASENATSEAEASIAPAFSPEPTAEPVAPLAEPAETPRPIADEEPEAQEAPEVAPAESVEEAAPFEMPEETDAQAVSQEADSEVAPEPTAVVEPTPSEHQETTAETEDNHQPIPAGAEPDATSSGLLPATAPPIRPPAEAGISRFEFGLGEPAAAFSAPLYQLPGAEEEEEATPAAPTSMPPFLSDAELAYALLGGGSRLGFALQLQDGELTAALPGDEFFAPDALLHAHARAHQPQAVPAPSSLDLINRFLKNQPRLKSPAVRLSLAEEQTDLSVRSTSVVPQLASESLAKIMVRQGKIDKAIEIYERLMVRQPEKSAYFADQIQQLQTPE